MWIFLDELIYVVRRKIKHRRETCGSSSFELGSLLTQELSVAFLNVDKFQYVQVAKSRHTTEVTSADTSVDQTAPKMLWVAAGRPAHPGHKVVRWRIPYVFSES